MQMATLVRIPFFVLALGYVGASAEDTVAAAQSPYLSADLVPVPTLSPDDVIRIQIEALRNNDESDRGVEVAFRFASPSNKSNTGPLTRFAAMLKSGPYALMLGFQKADFEPVEVRDDRARQRVTLTDNRQSLSFWFYLSRQSSEPFVDCWMTDAVLIEPFDGQAT